MRRIVFPSWQIGRLTTALSFAVGLFASMLAVSAASLGGVTVDGLFTQTFDVSIDPPDPPGPIVSTDFSGCTNFIDGWTDESGNTWTSHSGRWQCLGNDVVRSQQRVPFANLTVDITQTSGIRVSTNIFDISDQNNRSGPGISLLGNSQGDFLYIIYERDDEELVIGITGETPLATVTSIGDFDTGTLSAEISTDLELMVAFESVTVGPFDLTEEADGLLDNNRFGLVSNNDNFSRFNSFTIEALP
jgi:hypothetical protein